MVCACVALAMELKIPSKRGELSGHFRGGLRQSGSARQNKANIKPEVA